MDWNDPRVSGVKNIATALHDKYCTSIHKTKDHKPGLIFCSFNENCEGNPTSWTNPDKEKWFAQAVEMLAIVKKEIINWI